MAVNPLEQGGITVDEQAQLTANAIDKELATTRSGSPQPKNVHQ
jgi:hypothetical protein